MVLPRSLSLTANAAPSVLPTKHVLLAKEAEREGRDSPVAHPMLPHRTWLTKVDFSGNGTLRRPKLAVPVDNYESNSSSHADKRTCFCDDHVLGFEEITNPRPEPRMGNLVVVFVGDDI